MPCYSPLKGFKARANGGLTFRRDETLGEKMSVACGQCLGCRLDRSRAWATRIVHEASLYDDNCWITLTYRPKERCTNKQLRKGWHVPDNNSLNKVHFQKFMKRLRKRIGKRIRYYHCGEYGDEGDRPHYHACLFNYQFPFDYLFKENNGNPLFVSELLEELWPYGFSTVSELSWQNAAYTARYCLKKVSGVQAKDHYMRFDDNGVCYWLEPEYTTMSRRPGIGKDWFDEYKNDCFPSDEVPVPGQGVLKKVPRFYEEVFERSDPKLLESVKRERARYHAQNRAEYTPERLIEKYKVKKAQVKYLKREL